MTAVAPSPRAIEQAMSIAHGLLSGLEADQVDIDEDEIRILLKEADADVDSLVARLLRAAVAAEDDADKLARRQEVIAQRRVRHIKRNKACRDAVMAIMQALPQLFPSGRFRHPEFTVSLIPGQPSPIVTDEEALPADLWRTHRTPNLSAIRERLKTEAVPGVTLSNASPVLRVSSR